jgi:hypothetical protein
VSSPPGALLAVAVPDAAGALVVAALVAASDELVELVELLLHAVSTSAIALIPAMVAVNFFAGL